MLSDILQPRRDRPSTVTGRGAGGVGEMIYFVIINTSKEPSVYFKVIR